MFPGITDFDKLEEHVRESELAYREAILDYYKTLGEELGFTVRENSSVIVGGINYGKIDLVWVDPGIAFACEFGAFDEILKHLIRIMKLDPEKAVLILSEKSQCKPEQVKKLITEDPILSNIREKITIIDVANKKTN